MKDNIFLILILIGIVFVACTDKITYVNEVDKLNIQEELNPEDLPCNGLSIEEYIEANSNLFGTDVLIVDSMIQIDSLIDIIMEMDYSALRLWYEEEYGIFSINIEGKIIADSILAECAEYYGYEILDVSDWENVDEDDEEYIYECMEDVISTNFPHFLYTYSKIDLDIFSDTYGQQSTYTEIVGHDDWSWKSFVNDKRLVIIGGMVYKCLLDGTWIRVSVCDYWQVSNCEYREQLMYLYIDGVIVILGDEGYEETECDYITTCLPVIYSEEYRCTLDHPSQPLIFTNVSEDYKIEIEIGPKHHFSRFYGRFDHRGYCTVRNYKLKRNGNYRKKLLRTEIGISYNLIERWEGIDHTTFKSFYENRLMRNRTFYCENVWYSYNLNICGYTVSPIHIIADNGHVSINR